MAFTKSISAFFRSRGPLAALALLLVLRTAPTLAAEAVSPVKGAPPTVQGTVTDPLGAPVYNAQVNLVTLNGIILGVRTFTDGRGHYVLSST